MYVYIYIGRSASVRQARLKRRTLILSNYLGTQFTCFTGTKVQILTLLDSRVALTDPQQLPVGTVFEKLAFLVLKYLLYWYQST